MKFFAGLSKTARIMLAATAVVCVILLGAGLIAINFIYEFEKSVPFMAGIALGGVQSLVKIIILEKSLNRILDIGEKDKASGIGALLYFGRFILTGSVLIFAFIFPGICGPFGTIAGILAMQVAAYATNIFLKKGERGELQENQSGQDEAENENENDDEKGKEEQA